MSEQTRRGSGRRIRSTATYVEKAETHSEVLDSGCWRWLGLLHGGVPHVYPRPGDRSTPGVVNLRAAILVERGHACGDGEGPARPTCGTPDCVRPEHLDWTPAREFALAKRAAIPTTILSLDEVHDAYLRREAGEPVVAIARSLGISRQGLYRQWAKWVDGYA
jgi:hypothetical protein